MERKNFKLPDTESINQPTFERRSNWHRLVRALIPHPGTMVTTLLIASLFFFFQNAQAGPWAAPLSQTSGIPTVVSYQGQLLKLDGTPENSAGIPMTFRLYNSSSSTTELWEEVHAAVPVEDGLFQVLLGSVNAFPAAVVSANSSLWLGVSINTDSEMQPRAQFGTVPFAMIAGTVSDNGITTSKLADSVVTSRKVTLTYNQVSIPQTSMASSEWADVPNSTLTLNAEIPSVVEITADLLLHTDNADAAVMYAVVVNNSRITERFWAPGNGGFYSAVAHTAVPVNAGPVTVKLQWKRAYGSGGITLNNVGGQSHLSAKLWAQ
jgi:hypothetical protein